MRRGCDIRRRRVRGKRIASLLVGITCSLVLAFCMCACSLSDVNEQGQQFGKAMDGLVSGGSQPTGNPGGGSAEDAAAPIATDSVYASFDDGAAVSVGAARVDTSQVAQGYLGVKISDAGTFKVRLEKDETYTYDLSSDGTPNYYPLQMGDGTYRLTVYRNVTGNKYSTEGTKNIDVKLDNEFQPFMHPNVFSSYGERSAAVAQAQSLCAGLSTDTEKVSVIYQWLSKTIQYDYDFAKNPGDGYVPDPDRTLSTKKGICFDYASLAAAMIRSQQIPCKLITGYVQPNDIYHSWNMVYLQDKGWITTSIQASVDEWGRIDVTFEATSGDAQFVGNGSNYTTRYTY